MAWRERERGNLENIIFDILNHNPVTCQELSVCHKLSFSNPYTFAVPVQTSDVTNNGRILQTSDWDKRRTSTNVGTVLTLYGYIYKEKVGLWLSLKKSLFKK